MSRIMRFSCQAVAVTAQAILRFFRVFTLAKQKNEPLQTELRRGMRGWHQQADQHGAIRHVHLHLNCMFVAEGGMDGHLISSLPVHRPGTSSVTTSP